MNSIVSLLQLGLMLSLGLMLMGPTSGVPSNMEKLQNTLKLANSNRQMPLSHDMTLHERLYWSDDCKPLGAKCEMAEHCCTKVCLLLNRRCGLPIPYQAPTGI